MYPALVAAIKRKQVLGMSEETKSNKDGVFIVLPKTIGKKDGQPIAAVEYWTNPKTGKNMATITLPSQFKVGEQDYSFYSFMCTKAQVIKDPNNDNRISIIQPQLNNETGEPWLVKLSKDIKDPETGEWKTDEHMIPVTQMKEEADACRKAFGDRMAAKIEKWEEKRGTKDADTSDGLAAKAKEATVAADAEGRINDEAPEKVSQVEK